MPLPIATDITLKQLKALYDQGELSKYSLGYLMEGGYMHSSIWGRVLGVDNAGNLVWLPQDSTGRAPVIERWSETTKSYANSAYRSLSNMPAIGRMVNVGGNPTSTTVEVRKGAAVTLTVAGGGGAAAQQVLIDASAIPGIADLKKIYLEELHVSVGSSKDTTTGAPATGVVLIKDNGGTPKELYRAYITQGCGVMHLRPMCDLGQPYDSGMPEQADIMVEVEAGVVHLQDNDVIILTPYYRVV